MSRSLLAVRVWAISALMTVAVATSASADAIVFYDQFKPSDVFFKYDGGACVGTNGSSDSVSGQANGGCDSLTFSLFLPGYTQVTDTLYSALVSLAFHDDATDGSEMLSIQLDTLTKSVTVSSTSTNSSPFFYSFWNPLDQLATDGRVDLRLTQTQGDFWFDGAGVVAAGWRSGGTHPVPEPSSLLLMGAGATLLAAFRRRRQA